MEVSSSIRTEDAKLHVLLGDSFGKQQVLELRGKLELRG